MNLSVNNRWTQTTLGDVIELEYGKPLKSENRDGERFPVFGSAGQVGLHSAPLVQTGPVIIVGRKGTAGAVWWSELPCSVIDTAYYVVRKTDDDLRFLYLMMSDLDLPSLNAQTGVPGLNRDRAYSKKVLLPPISEQRRIVDVITSVDSYLEAVQKQIECVLAAKSALLEEQLEQKFDREEKVKLGDVLEISRGGSPRPIQEYLTDSHDGLNWIKIGDASNSTKYIYETKQKIKREGLVKTRQVFPGDFLLSNSMSFGRPYIMRTEGCIHDGWLLLGNVSKHFDEDFLYNLLRSSLIQAEFSSQAAGSGVKNLNIDIVSDVEITLPSIPEQRKIAELLNSFDAQELALKDLLSKALAMRNALLTDLLSGNHEIPTSYDLFLEAK